MKYLFGLITALFITSISAQTITRKDGFAGLVDASGEELLPREYNEITQVVVNYEPTHLYILWRNEKYGVYSSNDHKSTGCIYDHVWLEGGLLRIDLDGKTGFVARPDDTTYSIIEPMYDEVRLTSGGYYPFGILGSGGYKLSVRKDSLWGIVSHADGEQLVPCKYPYRLETTSDYPLMRMEYPNSSDELLINPLTGAEFPVSMLDHIRFTSDRTMILITDYVPDNSGTTHVRLCSMQDGSVVWSYSSKAHDIRINFLDNQIILAEETFWGESEYRNTDRKIYSFFNLTNGALLLKHEGKHGAQVSISEQPDRYVVFASRTYNGRKKEIGQIYK